MYKLKEVGATEMNVATPSTAAKIEWFVSDDGGAPYEHANGDRVTPNDSDFDVGDHILYGGEEYTVVQANRWTNEMTISPSEWVNIFDIGEYARDEAEYIFTDVVKWDELSAELEKGISPERANEIIDEQSLSSYTVEVLDIIAKQNKTITGENIDEVIKDDAIDKIAENYDVWDSLNSQYSFTHEDRYGNAVVSDWNTETMYQPEYYESSSSDWLDAIDENRDEMSNFNFWDDQESVLKNYYELKDYLDKYAKENNITVTRTYDPNGNTWFTLPIIPGKIKWF